jgi:hypothetical protein
MSNDVCACLRRDDGLCHAVTDIGGVQVCMAHMILLSRTLKTKSYGNA